MNKAYKFRIYPNKEQEILFAKTFGCVRFIYNHMLADKIAYYELANDEHKHYLICDKCNSAYPTDMCDIDKIARKIKRETGFNITGHTLEFHGICPNCRENA